VPAAAPFRPQAERTQWQVEVIEDHQQMLQGYLVEADQRGNRQPAIIHEGLGLWPEWSAAHRMCPGRRGPSSALIEGHAQVCGQPPDTVKPDVVPVEAYDKPGLPSPTMRWIVTVIVAILRPASRVRRESLWGAM